MDIDSLTTATTSSPLAGRTPSALVVEAPSSAGTQANDSSPEKQQRTSEDLQLASPTYRRMPSLRAEGWPATSNEQPERAPLEDAVVDTLVKEEPCEAQVARTTPVTLMLGADEEEASPSQVNGSLSSLSTIPLANLLPRCSNPRPHQSMSHLPRLTPSSPPVLLRPLAPSLRRAPPSPRSKPS